MCQILTGNTWWGIANNFITLSKEKDTFCFESVWNFSLVFISPCWNNHSFINVHWSWHCGFVYVISWHCGCLWCFVQASWHLIFSDSNHSYHKCQWRMVQWNKVKFGAFLTTRIVRVIEGQATGLHRFLYSCSSTNSEWLMPRKSPFIVSFCVTQIHAFCCTLTWPVVKYVSSENQYHGLFAFLCLAGQTKGRCICLSLFKKKVLRVFIWNDPVSNKETQKEAGLIKRKSMQKHNEFFLY